MSKLRGLFGFGSDSVEVEAKGDGEEEAPLWLAAPDFRVQGAVHSCGQAEVTVRRLHTLESGGGSEKTHLAVEGAYGSGSSSVEVGESMLLEHGDVPPPTGDSSLSSGFRNSSRRICGSEVRVDSLVVMPRLEEGFRGGPPIPFVVEPLANEGYECYSEVEFSGEDGGIELVIDDLYVYPDLPSMRQQATDIV